mgnify:CR=1 FL=1
MNAHRFADFHGDQLRKIPHEQDRHPRSLVRASRSDPTLRYSKGSTQLVARIYKLNSGTLHRDGQPQHLGQAISIAELWSNCLCQGFDGRSEPRMAWTRLSISAIALASLERLFSESSATGSMRGLGTCSQYFLRPLRRVLAPEYGRRGSRQRTNVASASD